MPLCSRLCRQHLSERLSVRLYTHKAFADRHLPRYHRFSTEHTRSLGPQTGRVSAEYCERPVKYGEQRCREIGAFRQWTKKQTDDPIFKAYRKEYKKRFAWIKAGRITDEQFYAWSEQAREEKKKCDREIISLEEFQQWLRDSKI